MQNPQLILCVFSLITCIIINAMDPVIKIENSDTVGRSSSKGKISKTLNLNPLKLSNSDPKDHKGSPRTPSSSSNSGSREPSPRIASSQKRVLSELLLNPHLEALGIADIKNIETVENPNQLIKSQSSILHAAVKTQCREKIYPLLEDYRINTLTMDSEKRMPIYYLSPKIDEELHNELEKRKLLDYIVTGLILQLQPGQSISTVIEFFLMNSTQSMPNYANAKFICNMTTSRLEYNKATIQNDIQLHINPNYQDKYKNTALHYAAYVDNEDLIEDFVRNSALDSLIENIDGLTADQVASNEDLKLQLSIRKNLDSSIKEEIVTNILSNPAKLLNNEDAISEMMHKAKGKLIIALPEYATDTFFRKAFKKRLKNLSKEKDIRSQNFAFLGDRSTPIMQGTGTETNMNIYL